MGWKEGRGGGRGGGDLFKKDRLEICIFELPKKVSSVLNDHGMKPD